MAKSIIRVENVSKKFCLSLKRSLWYGVQDLGSEIIGRKQNRSKLRKDEFWALKDVSFEIKPGESIGLIGRNGAGKTTLLRLLNGVIKPDQGRIEVRGRMQALIALGAGFNPILTGRENIFINAAILGISKSDIRRKFDDIVDFSGLEGFIDTPVQSYSSGMTVRLGFSVAVHMEPDILLIDEVLAVGDIPFRTRCHKKLGELKDKGIPWILVSHEMGTIRNQTNKVIFLDKGQIKFIGKPEEAISHYLYSISENSLSAPGDRRESDGKQGHETIPDVTIKSVSLLNKNDQPAEVFSTGEPLTIQIKYFANKRIHNPSFGFFIFGGEEILFTTSNTSVADLKIDYIDGEGCVSFRMDDLSLLPGVYRIRADIWDSHMGMLDKVNDAAYLHVKNVKSDTFGVGLFYSKGTWFT